MNWDNLYLIAGKGELRKRHNDWLHNSMDKSVVTVTKSRKMREAKNVTQSIYLQTNIQAA